MAQAQRFVDGGHPEFGGPGRQRRTRDRGRAMAVGVRLDHGHDLRRPGLFTQNAHVVGNCPEIDDGLGVGAGRRRISE